MQRIVIFCVFAVFALLPISSLAAETDPSIVSVQIHYPDLDNSPLPNSFAYPHQSAFKDGDETYFVAQVREGRPQMQVTADGASIGAGTISFFDTGMTVDSVHQFQSSPFKLHTDGKNGSYSIPIVVSAGESTTTSSFPIVIDNKLPRFSITKLISSAHNIVRQGDVLTFSGAIDGTGTLARLFRIFVQITDAAGIPISNGNEYYSTQLAAAVRDLRDGIFTDISLPLLDDTSALAHAAFARLSLLGKDEAGNVGTTSASLQLMGSSTPDSTPDSSSPSPESSATSSVGISNVLFLPGIESSRLYDDSGARRWEPSGDGDVNALFLDENGKSKPEIHTKQDDVIASAHLTLPLPLSKDLYASFFSDLEHLRTAGLMHAWEPVAYDWRLSLDDLLAQGAERTGNIFYGQSTSTPYIEQSLRALAASSKTGKVTIIAHSNGGLVAKALLQKLGSAETARLVDKLILISVPQSGTSEDVALMLFGYGGGLPFDSCATIPLIGDFCAGLLHRETARAFAEHSPVAFHLLPSAAYFRTVSDGRHHVIEFNANHAYAAERAAYKSGINSLNELHAFLAAKEEGRTKPLPSDLSHANVLTASNLLAYASTTHARIDGWSPPAGLQVYQIAGTGNATLSGIDFYDYSLIGNAGVRALYRPLLTFEGDGAVQAQSAIQLKQTTNVHNYWIEFNHLAGNNFASYDHANELEVPELRNFLTNILESKEEVPSGFVTSRPEAASFPRRLVLILHSPLTLEAYDEAGKHIGPNGNATFDDQIPFSNYGELGDTKYLVLPSIGTYRISLNGITDGTFTLDVRSMEEDVPAVTTSLAEIPTTARTRATLTVKDGTPSSLSVDENGDGSVDFIVEPKIGSTVQYKAAVLTSTPSTTQKTIRVSAPTPSVPVVTTAASGTAAVLGTATSTLPEVQEPATVGTTTNRDAESAAPSDTTILPQRPSIAPPVDNQSAVALLGLPSSFAHKLLSFLYSLFRVLSHAFARQ